MCGIAGIVRFGKSSRVEVTRLESMLSVLRHRGPDDEGLYASPDGSVGLVHARLSILDLSSSGHQPMSDPMSAARDRQWIVFNGEIYNFRALRKELEELGEHFQSQTDTEVILKLYQREGPACVRRLSGMFAFAIYDEGKRALFMARDFFGVKPLYYRKDGDEFLFASEVRAVLAAQSAPRSLDGVGLHSFLLAGAVAEPRTIASGVFCLPPAHWALLTDDGFTMSSYASISFPSEQFDADQAQRRLSYALRESVGRHFVSDVPVGILLSGGIDSAAVLALAQELGHGNIHTFTIGFSQGSHDESAIARRIARHYGARHTTLMLDGLTARALFHEYLACIDQPSVDGFNTFVVCRLARQQGMKVVLSGLGGDELFGGYQSFRRVPQMVSFSRRLGAQSSGTRWFVASVAGMMPHRQARRMAWFLRGPSDAGRAFQAIRSIFLSQETAAIEALLLHGGQSPDVRPEAAPGPDSAWPLPDQVSFLEIRRYMLNQLLRDSDAMSMASGVELRVPLVDAELFSVVRGIPWQLRLAPGKRMLTSAIGSLPEWLLSRPKRGFAFPFADWLEGEWGDLLATPKILAGVDMRDWYRRWCAAVLQDWTQRNGMLH